MPRKSEGAFARPSEQATYIGSMWAKLTGSAEAEPLVAIRDKADNVRNISTGS